jgi:hypothetical protein
MTVPRRRPGFDPGGWESGGWPIYGHNRYRLWVPPGTSLNARWGILIREDVSARGQLAILNAIPLFDLNSAGHIVLRRRE